MLRKIAILVTLFVMPMIVHATTISGNMKNLGVTNITGSNTFVRFTLEGYGANIPRVSGTNVIVPGYQDFHPDSSGDISGSIQGNDTISVGSNPTGGTWYQVCIYYQGQQFQCNNFTITGGTFNLNSATPNTTNPTIPAPTGDTTYLRLDAGNGPITGNLSVNGSGSFNGLTASGLNSVQYITPTSACVTDIETCFASIWAALPTKTINGSTYHWGTIIVSAGDYTLATCGFAPGPLVGIQGSGQNTVRITQTCSGDAFNVRDNPFNDDRGSNVGGFTLIGPGSSVTANGIHTGDLNLGRFYDMAILNYTGSASSCFWVDNQLGWWERNMVTQVSLGEGEAATGNSAPGCTIGLRFTVNGGQNSFSADEFYGIRFAPQVSGQKAISLEDGTLYHGVLIGNANVIGGTTIVSFTGGSAFGELMDLRAENDTANSSTGWNCTTNGLSFQYNGPGLQTNGDAHISDSITGTCNVVGEQSDTPLSVPTAAGAQQEYIPALFASGGQINESIAMGPSSTYGLAGLGVYTGTSVQHPLVWGYASDTNLFEIHGKTSATPLSNGSRRYLFGPNGMNMIGGIATVGLGEPIIVGKADATAQAANISATTVYAVPSSGAGTYRASCYVVLTQAATSTSTLPQCQITWTDADSSSSVGTYLTGTSTNNTVGTLGTAAGNGYFGATTFQAKASTNIQYQTISYASSGATAMQYAIHVKLEYLGP